MMHKTTMVAAFQALLLTATAGAAKAATSADVCGALKLRAAADYASREFNCHARAMLQAADVDPRCLQAAAERYQRLVALAETRPGCPGTDDDGTMLAIDAAATAAAERLRQP